MYMENYYIIKEEVNKKLLFKLSQIGYALRCNLLFTTRIPELDQNVELVNYLKNGDKIFISLLPHELTIDLHRLIQILQNNNIKVYFYLMYEPIVPDDIIELLSPVSLGFFINNNVQDQPNIHCMPIGIRDCEKVFPIHQGFSHDYLFNEGLRIVDKEYLCLMCFSYSHDERLRCYSEFKEKPFVINFIIKRRN